MVITNRQTSELIKYAGNAFLATKISFINEMADICEKTGANVLDVAKGIGLDGRIGKLFLHEPYSLLPTAAGLARHRPGRSHR